MSSAFFDYYDGIAELRHTLGNMLEAAIQSGRLLRAAQKEALAVIPDIGTKDEALKALRCASAEVHKNRPVAQLNATAVLVSAWALVEGLRDSAGVGRDVHHGPQINGIAFSQLLWAAGNSTRHGLSWWTALMRDLSEHVRGGGRSDSFDPRAPYDKQQVKSVEVLVAGLGLTWSTVSPTPDICYDAVEALSDGQIATFVRRLYDVGGEIAESSADARAAFDVAMQELGYRK